MTAQPFKVTLRDKNKSQQQQGKISLTKNKVPRTVRQSSGNNKSKAQEYKEHVSREQ